MTILLDKMKDRALSLPINDRAKLAHELLISLDEHTDSDIANAWDMEISRRVKKVKDGRAKGRSTEQILSEIRAKYQ